MKWQVLVALAVGLLMAADTPKEDPAKKKEQEKLQGIWQAESFEADGNPLPEEAVKACKFTFKDEKYTFELADMKETGTIKLDSGKDMATIDLKIGDGNDKDKTQLGIYKVDGDTLKFCFAQPGVTERPKEFSAPACSGRLYMTFKREKK